MGGGHPLDKKGFTLIELLAVIVILAIIALIATPIVLNIIKNSKESSNKRSIDMYASAVENAIASYQIKEGKAPTTFSDITDYIEYNGSPVSCSTSKIYLTGKIYLADCKVNNVNIENYSYGEREKACEVTEGDGTHTGDKITCGTESFYVLTNDGTNIQMLAQYNLNIGKNPYPSDPVGLQSVNVGEPIYDTEYEYEREYYGFSSFGDYRHSGSINFTDKNDENLSNYKESLKNIGITNLSIKFGLDKDQLELLGCTIDTQNSNNNCESAPEWINGYYWIALAPFYGDPNTPDEGYWEYKGGFYDNGNSIIDINSGGIRPVVTIPTSELK